MKLGLVLECGIDGPDALVLTCFARRLQPEIEVETAGMGSKEALFAGGIEAAENLIGSSGCDLALIVWDLKPYWEDADEKNCKSEADLLRSKLEGVDDAVRSKIRLLCITWELETWLIAEPAAVVDYLSTTTRKAVFSCKKPLAKNDAKATLDKACKAARGNSRRYEDYREAIRIARHITSTSKLRGVPSFARFSALITGNSQADFQDSGDACADLSYIATQRGR